MTMPHLMNCAHLDDGWCLKCVKRLHDEKEKLRELVVWGFYENEYPLYTQGQAGEHEICSPMTASEANGLIARIKTLEQKIKR